MRLLITRPLEDAEPLAALLRERGIESALEPLMSIVDSGTPDPDLSGVQAVLITSANGIRAFSRRQGDRGIAVFTVGEASARAARGLGFENVTSAAGDVDALAAAVEAALDPAAGALVHVAGTRVAGDLAGALEAVGFEVRREVLYEGSAARELSPQTREALAAGGLDGVVLFSPRTAAVLVSLMSDAGLSDAGRGLVAYCLSQAVADKLKGLHWRDMVIAPEPNQDALLETIPRKG
ncbi:MAG: uroporphyrinogen-III synthase [Proteobacteria bacterium]|nr:uroporphyrinogen-III synthase [Pseudomonadota bacterium]